MQGVIGRPCRECWKRFWPRETTEWVCPRCREQRKLVEWADDGEEQSDRTRSPT